MNDLRRQLTCFNPGEWFQFPKRFLNIMSIREAVFLSGLINMTCIKIDAKEDEEGWISCTSNDVLNYLNIPKHTQERILMKLKGRHFIKIKKKGIPAKRWIFINIHTICDNLKPQKESNLMQQNCGNSTPQKCGDYTLYKESSYNNKRQKLQNKKINKKIDHPRWIKYAQKLASSIQSVRQVNSNSNIRSWSNSFKLLHEKDEIPISKIHKVLNWYCSIIKKGDLITSNEKYIPIAYTGQTFREKFLRIEDAMNRIINKEPVKETINLSNQEKDMINHLKKIWQPIGLNESSITPLYLAIKKWKKNIYTSMEKVKKENEPINSSEGKVILNGKKSSYHYTAKMIIEVLLPEYYEGYFKWIIEQIEQWEGWEGELNYFYPKGRHFKRFVERILQTNNQQYCQDVLEML